MIYRFGELGEFRFNDLELELRRAGEVLQVQPKALEVLAYLLHNANRVVSKDELLDHVWDDQIVFESAMFRCVSLLRTALGESTRALRYIATVYGRGYRFQAPFEIEETASYQGSLPPSASSAPPAHRPPGHDCFVGRGELIAELESALEAALSGRGRLLLLSGEAGIGKSYTAEHFLEIAGTHGASVRIGRCREEGDAPPLWPWTQIFQQEREELGASVLERLLGREAADVTQLFPGLAPQLPDSGEASDLLASSNRFRLFDSVWRVLRRACQDRARVLVIDDLHRADPSSLGILRFLAAEIHRVPLFCIGTFRAAELADDPGRQNAVAALMCERGVVTSDLGGLSAKAVAELAKLTLHRDLGPADAERLRCDTAGNPFFLRQLLPLLDFAEDGAVLESLPKLPRGVRSALAREVDRLDIDARRLLQSAAALGREFTLSLLSAMNDRAPESVLEAVDAAIARGLIAVPDDRPGHYRFVHTIIREVLYEELSELDRARLHRRAGAALEAVFGDRAGPHLNDLAHHFVLAAEVGGSAKATEYSRRAGLWAMERMAYEDANDHLSRALALSSDLQTDPVGRCEVLIALTQAQARLGRRAAAAETCDRAAQCARELGWAEGLAQAALALAPGFFSIEIGVYDPHLAALLEEALEALDDAADDLRAQLLSRLALCLLWSKQDGQHESVRERALETARRARSAEAWGAALLTQYVPGAEPEAVPKRFEAAMKLVEHADRCRDPDRRLMSRVFLLASYLEQGRVVEFDRELIRFEELAERIHQPQGLWFARMFRSTRALMSARFDEVRTLSAEFLALGQRVEDNNALHCFHVHWVNAVLESSTDDALVEPLEAHVRTHPEVPAWGGGLANIYAETGHLEKSRALLEARMSATVEDLPRDMQWLSAITYYGYTAWHLRAEEYAESLYEQLRPYAHLFVTAGLATIYYGSGETALGRMAALMNQRERALGHFERALAHERQRSAHACTVRVQESLVQALFRFGDRTRAEALGRETLALAQRHGMVRVARRLERLVPRSIRQRARLEVPGPEA